MHETAELFALILGGVAVAATMFRFGMIIYRWSRRIEQALNYLESEMKLNGGNTLRDAVWRLEEGQQRIEERLAVVEDEVIE